MQSHQLSALILAAGFVLAASVLAITWRSNRMADQTVTVTGSATAEFRSDLGVLRITVSAQAATGSEAYTRLRNRLPVLLKFITDAGVDSAAISEQPMTSFAREEFDHNGMSTGRILYHQYSQRFEIVSRDVETIQTLSLTAAGLVQQGLDVMVEQPEYHFTGLDSLRISIQAAAAANATERARAIAEATGQELGPLSGARMGVLQITPVLSNNVSDYGFNDLSSIDKKITGVVSATFRIY